MPKTGPSAPNNGKGADFFLTKFWTQILADPGCRHIVDWDPNGVYLIIYNTDDLMAEIKKRSVCKQKDYDSFARQLRIYRWGRVRSDEQGMQPWPDTAKVWRHPRLTRDSDVSEVGNITRNAPPKPNRGQGAVNISGVRRKATDGLDDDLATPRSYSSAPPEPVVDPVLISQNLQAQTAELGLTAAPPSSLPAPELMSDDSGGIDIAAILSGRDSEFFRSRKRKRRRRPRRYDDSTTEEEDEEDDYFEFLAPKGAPGLSGGAQKGAGLLDSLALGTSLRYGHHANGRSGFEPLGLAPLPMTLSVPMPVPPPTIAMPSHTFINGSHVSPAASLPFANQNFAASFDSLPWLAPEKDNVPLALRQSTKPPKQRKQPSSASAKAPAPPKEAPRKATTPATQLADTKLSDKAKYANPVNKSKEPVAQPPLAELPFDPALLLEGLTSADIKVE